jgi:hypothetical protein
MAGITCDMTRIARLFPRRSWPALLCASIVMVACAAPVLVVVTCDLPEFLKLRQDHQESDLTDTQTDLEDATDDPVMFFSISKAGLLPLMFALRPSHLTERAWSPTSPVRPPNNLNEI